MKGTPIAGSTEAIAELAGMFPGWLFVSACGHITRDLVNLADRPAGFCLVGSMGYPAPVGIEVALVNPGRPVVVLDDDHSFAVNRGLLPVVAKNCPDLVHLVLGDGSGDPAGVALAAGYAVAESVHTVERLRTLDLTQGGAILVQVVCASRDTATGTRTTWGRDQLTHLAA